MSLKFTQELSSSFPRLLTDNPIYNNPTVRTILFTLGAGYAFCKAFYLIKNTLAYLFRFEKDLATRYGRYTWAVITGASDGIGKAFAFELAKREFNIVLVGRNEEKLKNVEKELLAQYPKTQTRVVVKDFSLAYEEGFAEEIYQKIKDLDISILINNAGQSIRGYYHDISLSEIRNVILVNCLAHALITRVLLPKLAARAQKSAIINMASTAASYPRPIVQVYSASKAFHDYLSQGLVYEHPNIDVISLKPGSVATKMTGQKGGRPSMTTITPEQFVDVGLRSLGSLKETHGHWKHVWRWVIGSSVPEVLKPYYFKKVFDMK